MKAAIPANHRQCCVCGTAVQADEHADYPLCPGCEARVGVLYARESSQTGSQRCDRTPDDDCESCPGWAVFTIEAVGPATVQRCDECQRFDSDEAAVRHVLGELS